jgi:hypothetical protein
MSTLIKLRRDTAANWAAQEPVLALGEPGYDTTNNELRIGNGTDVWSDLTPIAGGGAAGLPLANGSTNFNIATADGNATITTAGDYNWIFDSTGNLTIPNDIVSTSTIDIDNRASGNSADIRLYAADDITLQARDRTAGSTLEGGDINIYAGDSAEDSDTSGGDVQIVAGDGGAANVDYGGSGGFINIQSGNGGAANVAGGINAQSGGDVTLQAGYAGDATGNTDLGASGGDVFINSGFSTGNNMPGGNIYLVTGAGAANGPAGVVEIAVPSSGNFTGGTWKFNPNGTTVFPTLTVDIHNGGNQIAQTLQFGDTTQQAIITGPTPAVDTAAQRLIIQGQRGLGTGEGGDVYVWGGDTDGTNGGDIKIYAGDADNVASGQGGYVNIDGGAGFDAGGMVEITGGYSSNGTGGQANLRGGQGNTGGAISIEAGRGQAGPGGLVTIQGGISDNGPAEYGNVNIVAGTSTWSFDNTGNLTLPSNTASINYANGDPFSGGPVNTGNVTFDNNIVIGTGDSGGGDGLYLAVGPNSLPDLQYLQVRGGDQPTHIHFDTGNNAYYDQYIGNDNKFVKLEAGTSGNIVVGTIGASEWNWTFDSNGDFIVPGDIATKTTGFPFSGNITGITTGTDTVVVTFTGFFFPAPLSGEVTISDVVGTTEANGTWYYQAVDGDDLQLFHDQSLTQPVDGTTWTAYVSGGLCESAGYSDLTITGGIVEIVTNVGNTWAFGNDGVLTLPNGGEIDNDANNIELRASNNINLEAGEVVNIYTASGTNQWQFGDDGNLIVPVDTVIQTPLESQGNIIIHPDDGGSVIIRGGTSTLLILQGDLPDTQNRFEIDTYGANLGNLGGGVFTGTYLRTNGPTLNNDRLASFAGKGTEDGITLQLPTAAKITLDAGGNWSEGNTPSHISFWTTAVGANVSSETTRITPSGNLILYSGNALVSNGYVRTTTYTTATLPVVVANLQGARAFVSDADTRAFGNLVVGGAGNVMPVWCDGTQWYIG